MAGFGVRGQQYDVERFELLLVWEDDPGVDEEVRETEGSGWKKAEMKEEKIFSNAREAQRTYRTTTDHLHPDIKLTVDLWLIQCHAV